MIIKILNASSRDFNGVRYNDKKIDNGSGELMKMKNFPSFINEESTQKEVRDYLKAISESKKVKKPQFHAVISTKFQEHTKEELTDIAEKFMDEMGYGEQPYIVVFHHDTENNHVHIVSTRVDKKTGKKIDDSFEKLKSQKALAKVLEQINPDETLSKAIDQLLNYRFGTLNQLSALLERNGFRLVPNKQDENSFDILKNGVRQRTLKPEQMVFQNSIDKERKQQLKAILYKYSKIFSNKVFKVIDDRKLQEEDKLKSEIDHPKISIEFESELQEKLRSMFGIDILFHHKEGKKPFGYTLIDNKTKAVFKGSEILKMEDIFHFTDSFLDKKTYESLKDYYLPDEDSKEVLLKKLNCEYTPFPIKDFMVFVNKKMKPKDIFKANKKETLDFIKSKKNGGDRIKIIYHNEKHYAIHSRYHQVLELEQLIGKKAYQEFLNPQSKENNPAQYQTHILSGLQDSAEGIMEAMEDFLKPHYTVKDPAEEELKKRRRRKR